MVRDEPGIEDQVLAERARGGDRRAFDTLMDRHFDRVLRIAHGMLGNREDAEDVAQSAFARAHGSLAQLKGGASFASWVTRIAIHACLDLERARGARPEWVPLDVAEHAPAPATGAPLRQLTGREALHRVEQELHRISPRFRSALLLRVVHGMPYPEVAEVLGTTVRSARMYVFEARRELARRLGPLDAGDTP